MKNIFLFPYRLIYFIIQLLIKLVVALIYVLFNFKWDKEINHGFYVVTNLRLLWQPWLVLMFRYEPTILQYFKNGFSQ